eukprot:CAMPEP_0119122234 /NCGR_PEP_ID=MMETSP1310-20130426/2555_1 /TAXON_ID=464262 /ORGANISM="Genus nov. species nov., Strain RCC2339" /LENGTH=156 /DNA_ID=CAMNT_0007111859 /DNA_START=164 /DNA_END=632 /DNA_ORIENTATION=+
MVGRASPGQFGGSGTSTEWARGNACRGTADPGQERILENPGKPDFVRGRINAGGSHSDEARLPALKTEREALLDGATAIDMGPDDVAAREAISLNSSNQIASDIIQYGINIRQQLSSQGAVLKGAQRKVLDMGVQLGLSNSVIRMIERRGWTDRIL